jgi:hypothetical protein
MVFDTDPRYSPSFDYEAANDPLKPQQAGICIRPQEPYDLGRVSYPELIAG